MKTQIMCSMAPAAIGPYSQAVKAGNTLYVSGQLGIDVLTGEMPEGVADQVKRSMENVKSIVTEAGGKMENVVRCTIYLKDMNDFGVVNEIYGSFFKEPYPARATVEVARLPKDAKVEIDAIAIF